METKKVTLNPGDSQVVSFEVKPTVAKTYHVSVDGLTGSFEAISTAQTGIIQGYVVDAETGEHIPNAAIYLDGEFALYSWAADVGGYRIADIPYGPHTITVEANDYETTSFQIVVDRPIQSINLEMPPLPPAPPGEWSEGVEVQSVFVKPSTVYQGETANIKVYIQYGIHDPSAYPTPTTIFGTVKVNGQELREEFNIDYRNPTLGFPYTATQIGEFTAIAQGKSATFEVVEKVVGAYYSPFGGTRFPVCTKLTVPGVGVLTSGKDWYGIPHPSWGNIFRTMDKEFVDRLSEAYPSAWNPPGAVVRKWEMLITRVTISIPGAPMGVFAFIMPTDYDCPPYWMSKEELADVIATTPSPISTLGTYLPKLKEWIPQFGKISLFVGFRDWGEIKWGKSGGYGSLYTDWIYCPYCGKAIGHTTREYAYSSPQYLVIVRKLLEHIENNHPEHPLTEPAWF